MNKRQFESVRKAACQAAEILSGDCQYTDPAVNRAACESMVLGWLMGQSWFIKESARVQKAHRNEDVFLTAKDKVMEAVSDAVGGSAIFDESKGFDTGAAKKVASRVRTLALSGLFTDGAHHKQEALGRILKTVDAKAFETASASFPDLRQIE